MLDNIYCENKSEVVDLLSEIKLSLDELLLIVNKQEDIVEKLENINVELCKENEEVKYTMGKVLDDLKIIKSLLDDSL